MRSGGGRRTEEEEGGGPADIKSNKPHVTGGEQQPSSTTCLQSLFHKTIQETPLVDGKMWLPSGLSTLYLRNVQLVFSRRQLKMGHPSRLGLGTSCDQLKDGAHFGLHVWSSTSEVVDFCSLKDNYTPSFLRAHDNHITTISL